MFGVAVVEVWSGLISAFLILVDLVVVLRTACVVLDFEVKLKTGVIIILFIYSKILCNV